MVEESYKLLEDGRVEYIYKTDETELKGLDNKTVIGKFHNMSVNYVDSKDVCVNDLKEKYEKYIQDLNGIENQFNNIYIDLELFKDLKSFDEKCAEVLKAVKEIKDFSGEDYVANNPKKFGKMLKEANTLKSNMISHLTELDKAIQQYNRKEELEQQIKLYVKETDKIKKQIEEVEKL